jgi:hypothetical protein
MSSLVEIGVSVLELQANMHTNILTYNFNFIYYKISSQTSICSVGNDAQLVYFNYLTSGSFNDAVISQSIAIKSIDRMINE